MNPQNFKLKKEKAIFFYVAPGGPRGPINDFL